MDEKGKQKKRQNVRDECFEHCMDNNEKIVNYNLLLSVNK